jgi:peptidoglycan/xylan/chitin deacetylase (PgdA/CDA1 family)
MTDGSKYDPNHLTDELTVMIDKGYEVGLHGGYDTYNNIVEIKREKEQLEQIIGKRIIGYRNHFLRFKVPDTWLLLKNAGFEYDSTLGYSETVGFRNGMCHPFNPFDLYENKEINIVEIPPVIMDLTLLRHMKLDLQRGWDLCKRIIDTVESLNGVVTVIWHNESYNNAYRKNWEKIYSKILEYGYKKDAWMTSGKEICRWWQAYGEKKL